MKWLQSFNSLQVVYQLQEAVLAEARGLVFQFLIGSLSTKRLGIKYRYVRSFNSLQVVYQPAPARTNPTSCPVSIPYRQSINFIDAFHLFPVHRFQFLIGSLSTNMAENFLIQEKQVSIPYRQSINPFCPRSILVVLKFQFLIGSLSTFRLLRDRRILMKFQFLIGSLSTPELPLRCAGMGYSFNSLQVVYQQLWWCCKRNSHRRVSIPYRQSINQHQSPSAYQVQGQFQFLIGSLSTLDTLL